MTTPPNKSLQRMASRPPIQAFLSYFSALSAGHIWLTAIAELER